MAALSAAVPTWLIDLVSTRPSAATAVQETSTSEFSSHPSLVQWPDPPIDDLTLRQLAEDIQIRGPRGRRTAPRYTEPVDRIVAVATKRPLHEPDTSWVDYWRDRPIEERLAMATELSLECSDATPDTRLHRVHRVLRST